jgi:protein TonB
MKTLCLIYSFVLLTFSFGKKCVGDTPAETTILQRDTSKPVLYLYTNELPKYPGGNEELKKFIIQNLHWPNEDISYNGTIILSFVIEKNGFVSNIKIEKGSCEPCNRESIKIISLFPQWIPGKINHKPVRTLMYIPLDFIIAE